MSSAADKEISRLKDQVADLTEQLTHLRSALRADAEWLHELGLSGKPQMIVSLLLRHRLLSRTKIEAALYWSRGADIPSRNSLEVHISRARQVLGKYGVEIKTQWGDGWYFDAESRSKMEELHAGFITASPSKKPRNALNG